jgi:hypothetical protein
MLRASRFSLRWLVGAFALVAVVTLGAPRAMAQDGGENPPPQVDPDSPVQLVKNYADETVERIETAVENAENRLFGMIGLPAQSVRREADRSIKGLNEIVRRANNQLTSMERGFLKEFKRIKAPKAKVDELKAAVKTARERIKAAAATGKTDILTQRDRTLRGDVAQPNPPQPGPG